MPRTDDDSLGDETVLWRRIIPSWIAFKDGRYRPASFAFVDRRSFEVSVFVAHLTDQDELMNPYPSDGLVAFPARLPRTFGGIVAATPENPHQGHRVLVFPDTRTMRKAAEVLANSSQWVRFVPPPS